MAKSRDNRNRVDYTIRLFEERDREQRDIVAEVGRTTPSGNGAWASFSLPYSYTSPLFVTSPTATRVTPVPPNAPIKPRKLFSIKGLEPKKLCFTDKDKKDGGCDPSQSSHSSPVLGTSAITASQRSPVLSKGRKRPRGKVCINRNATTNKPGNADRQEDAKPSVNCTMRPEPHRGRKEKNASWECTSETQHTPPGTEKAVDESSDGTGDINCSQKSADFSIKMSKQKAEFSKQHQDESEGRLDSDSLSAMLQNMRIELGNKENRRYGQGRYEKRARNNRSVAKKRAKNNNDFSQSSKSAKNNNYSLQSSKSAKNNNNSSQSKSNYSPEGFKNPPIALTPCKATLSKVEKLLWLQPRRDVGVWIQCCKKKCKKWRYCDDFHDPVDVPKLWYCKKNSNKTIASCLIPEQPITKEIEADLIENRYNAGSLVWGRVDGYPHWWPAIVDDCPEVTRFYELEELSIIPVKYHVTFLKDSLEHAWLNLKNIKVFIRNRKSTLVRKQSKFYEINQSLKKAYALAQSAIPLSIYERLQKFSYISRLRNLQGSMIQSSSEQDDEIFSISTKSTEYITLKEFYLKNKRNTKDK